MSEQSPPLRPHIPKPNELFREWNPDYFSDSTNETTPEVTGPFLEFQLDQLTVNRKETEFEEFCRLLVQREVCPNLVPQTGPVGGGDSHTDAETYPVDQQLARERYWGPAPAVAGQNWAFAFSAKKTFAPKLRTDVAKIAGLPRAFDRVYFVTNQPVADKKRRQHESELQQRHGFEVRILDRTWIVERVLQGKHFDLLRTSLRLDLGLTTTRRIGPRDTERQAELDALLAKLTRPRESYRSRYEVAADHLEAGKLAAHLEKPRTEVEGFFSQAFLLAHEIDHIPLMVEALYQRGWKAVFWYDDFQTAESVYTQMEPLLSKAGDADTVELFSNLLTCLWTGIVTKQLDLARQTFEKRDRELRARLKALGEDANRPNNALQARTVLAFYRLPFVFNDPEKTEEAFAELERSLRAASHLGRYPFMAYVQNVRRLGELCCERPGYGAMLDGLEPIIAKRVGETEAGLSQLEFGFQLMEKERYADALKRLGRATVRLAKEETRRDLVAAAVCSGLALKALGLFWAARVLFLVAFHFAIRKPEDISAHSPVAFRIFVNLATIEQQLGRLGPFLAWWDFLALPQFHTGLEQEDIKERRERLTQLTGCLAVWVANLAGADITELRDYTKLLESEGLVVPAAVLLHRLGVTAAQSELLQRFERDFKRPVEKTVEMIRDQPAADQMPHKLTGETRGFWTMETQLFGVRYAIVCQNHPELVWLAEEMLGALECVAAFARVENLAFIGPEFVCTVIRQDQHTGAPRWQTAYEYDNTPRLVFGGDYATWLDQEKDAAHELVRDFVLRALLTTTLDPPKDILAEYQHLLKLDVPNLAFGLNSTRLILADAVGAKRYVLSERHAAEASTRQPR